LRDLDASAVIIQDLLHQLLNARLDVLPRAGQDRLNVGTADNLTHRALGHRLHGAFRHLDIEQIVRGAVGLDHPEHREVDVDDVLVAGEHQALFRYVARCAAAPQVLDQPHTDIDAVHTRDLRQQYRLNRIRQMIVQAGPRIARVLAKPEDDAEFVRLDPEESGQSPQCDRGNEDQNDAFAAEIAARKHFFEPVLATPQKLFEIGRS
jgi:hypothetical protein